MPIMMVPRIRLALLVLTVLAAAGLGTAFASEWWGGLVPCALCLVERWPYRIAIVIGVAGLILPRAAARVMIGLFALTMIAGAAAGAVHVGVENKLWPSPLPQCQAPNFTDFAHMPDHPSKSCEDPTYLIPGLPISMAAMNVILALVLAGGATAFLFKKDAA
jgi:disulfide bond formation protein DsbB